jgi:hypothetical protein
MRSIGHYAGMCGFVLSSSLSSSAYGYASFRTGFSEPNLLPDGITSYEAYVFFDNTGLNGVPTQALQWRLIAPEFLIEPSYGVPPIDQDFFAVPRANGGIVLEIIRSAGLLSLVQTRESDAVANGSGLLQVFQFTVPVGTVPGTYSFSLVNVVALGPSVTTQPHVVENVPFVVLPSPAAGVALLVAGGIGSAKRVRRA